MPTITLIQYPGLFPKATLSPPCGKVHMALHFKGLAYKVKNVSTPGQAKRFNPRGRVPSLLIDGETIVDSTDILTALNARFPDPPLEPRPSAERALAKVLEDWADDVLYWYGVFLRWCAEDNRRRLNSLVLARLPIPFRWIVPIVAIRTVRKRASGQGVGLKSEDVVRQEFRECLDALVGLLEGKVFLVGDTFTRADLSVVAMLDQLRLPQLSPDAAAEIESRPALVAWLERVHRLVPNAALTG